MLHHLSRRLAPRLRPLGMTGTAPTLGQRYMATRSDPLRILFCGSDLFSCESLRALHREHQSNGQLVESLDVMVLPPRRMGRGFKQLREVPCKTVAQQLGLKIHQRETFRDWNLPEGTNLIVVVSFGLFVPPRILQSAKYGGLNVHPSLLPDLRGPAPIHHAMLRGDKHMGISLQTLDDKQFDHGTILAQTPLPGMPIPPAASLDDMLQLAAVQGAELLVQGLRDGVHIPPHGDVGWKAADSGSKELAHAPKVTKADGQVDWVRWTTTEQFQRRLRVLGSVWTMALTDKGESKRVIFTDVEAATVENTRQVSEGAGIITCYQHMASLGGDEAEPVEIKVRIDDVDKSCLLNVDCGSWIRIRRVKVDGKPEQDAAHGLRSFIKLK